VTFRQLRYAVGMNEKGKARRYLPVALLLLTSAAYAPSLAGTFHWDDKPLILKNPYIRNFKHLGRNLSSAFWNVKPSGGGDLRANIYFRPLVTLSYMVDHALYGFQPWGYHLTNVLLHALAVLMVYWLGIRLFASPWYAFAAALVFALHPSRTEVVAWISGRTGSMMAISYVASLIFFWRYLSGESERKRTLLFAWLTYLLAMVCKETALSLVPAVVALDYLILKDNGGGRRKRNMLWCHVPLVAATAIFLVFRVFYQGGVLSERPSTGLWPRLVTFLETIGHYGWLTLNPYDPSLQVAAFYNPAQPNWTMVGGGAALLVVFCVGLYWAIRRKAPAAWALLFTMAAVAPVSNLIPLSLRSLVAERFLYLPLLGVAYLIGFGLQAARPAMRRILSAVLVLLCLSWTVVDATRSYQYADELQLWLSTAESSPDNPLAQQMVASALVRRGRHIDAEKWFAKSLKNWIRVQQTPEVVAVQLGWLDLRLLRSQDRDRKFLEALATYLGRLAEMVERPAGTVKAATLVLGDTSLFVEVKKEKTRSLVRRKRAMIYSMLGTVHSRLGRDELAIAAFEKSLLASAHDVGTMLNASLAYARAFRVEQAFALYQRAKGLQPQAGKVVELGKTLVQVDTRLKRLAALEASLPSLSPSLQPTSPPLGQGDVQGNIERAAVKRLRAETYMILRSPARAEKLLKEAIALSPDDRRLRAVLALELAAGLELEKALEVIKIARQRFGAEAGIDQLERQIHRVYREEERKRR
jgi:protein O-mannosyl-transferase